MAMMPGPMMADPMPMAMAGMGTPAAPEPAGVEAIVLEVEVEEEPRKAVESEPLVKALRDEEKADECIEQLKQHWTNYSEFRAKEVEPQWDVAYRAYKGFVPDNTPYTHVYVIRKIFQICQTIIANVNSQLGGPELFRLDPEDPGLTRAVNAASAILKKQIRETRSEQEMVRWRDACVLYGNSYAFPSWETFLHTERTCRPMFGEDDSESWWEWKTDETPVESGRIEFVKPWDVWVHPFVEDARQSPCVFRRQWVSPGQLKTLVREGKLDRKAVVEAADSETAVTQGDYPRPQDTPEHEDLAEDRLQELLWCWTNNRWEYAILDPRGESVLVRGKRSLFKRIPVLSLVNYPMVGEHYGTPEPFLLMEDQNVLNDILGMWFENLHMSCVPMFFVKKSAQTDFQKAKWGPGGHIPYDIAGDVQPVNLQPHVFELQNAMQIPLTSMEAAPGVTREVMGTGTTAGTATGQMQLYQAANIRMQYRIKQWQPEHREAYKALYMLNGMFLTRETAVKLSGADGKDFVARYPPTVFEPDVDVTIVLGNEASTADEVNRLMMWYKTFGMDPLVNRRRVMEEATRLMFPNNYKPGEFILNPAGQARDAMRENEQWASIGAIRDAAPEEDHQLHMMEHLTFSQTPVWHIQPPNAQVVFIEHVKQHKSFYEWGLKQNAALQMAPGMGPPGPLATGQGMGGALAAPATEARFGNAMTGGLMGGGQMPRVR